MLDTVGALIFVCLSNPTMSWRALTQLDSDLTFPTSLQTPLGWNVEIWWNLYKIRIRVILGAQLMEWQWNDSACLSSLDYTHVYLVRAGLLDVQSQTWKKWHKNQGLLQIQSKKINRFGRQTWPRRVHNILYYTNTNTNTHTHTNTHTNTCAILYYTILCICMYARTYVHTYSRKFMHSCIHAFIHSFIDTYIRTYVRTYIYCIVLYCTVLYGILWYCIVLYCIVRMYAM